MSTLQPTSDANETKPQESVAEATTRLPDDLPEITNVWTQRSIIYQATSAHRKVEGVAGKQFVFAVGSVSISRSELELVLGDSRYPSVSEFGDIYVANVIVDERYTSNEQRVFGFVVPDDIEPERGAIEWTAEEKTVTWQLSEDVVSTIANPPEFEVTGFTAPDQVGENETFTVSATIVNRGGTRGIFRAEFGTEERTDQDEITVPLERGEQTSWSETIDAGGYDESELTVTLDWGVGSKTKTVQRKSSTTTQ